MSYPYPQDRHRDRKEKGEQPYKDSREEMAQTDATMQAQAEAFGEARDQPGAPATTEELEAEAPALLRRVHPEGQHN
jgi:hypothetical protein